RMSPAGTSRTAAIGAAVANFCMVLLLHQRLRSVRPAVSDERKATLRSKIWQRTRCAENASMQVKAEISLQWFRA
ncbi:hypothetical protein ACGFNX_27955, partial [Streptomyces sp. NPDC048723]|uniref:hypothetical protein n=1 Tax=Streptomyces sp. NPDC048723 TaxID=3365589 RepID=UPI003711B64F